MPEKLNFDTQVSQDRASNMRQMIQESKAASQDTKSKSRSRGVEVTLKSVIGWIEEQEYDEYTTQELIKTISKYPHGVLPRYKQLVKAQLSRIAKQRREENR